jgi:hypothetical protein
VKKSLNYICAHLGASLLIEFYENGGRGDKKDYTKIQKHLFSK